MIDTSSWDQSFVDCADDLASKFGRLRQSPSDVSDAVQLVASGESRREGAWSDDDLTALSRPRTLDDVVACMTWSIGDTSARCPIDARCAVAPSGTGWSAAGSTRGRDSFELQRRSDTAVCSAGGADHFENWSLSKCDVGDDPLYENTTTAPPPPAIVGAELPTLDERDDSRRPNIPEVTSSSGAVVGPLLPTSSRLLLFPGEGATRKASPSSSASSACDSVLELATLSSSRCSSCSEATTTAATPLGDVPSLPDSGNGSVDAAAAVHVRLPLQLGCDPGTSRRPGAACDATSSYCVVASFLPDWDAERLDAVYGRLAECGFYYGRLSIESASELLRQAPVGTFLLRDSADDRYLFSISVQTCRGTTSIRVVYCAGLFRLDCSPEQEHLMPTFDCVLRLVVHYVRICCSDRRKSPGGGSYVFLESSGRRDTPVLMRRPLYRRADRLAHLCRRAVHRALYRGAAAGGCQLDHVSVVDRLQLIPSLKSYLKDYPYEL